MKKLLIGLMVVLVACAVWAGSAARTPILIPNCAANVTNSATHSSHFDGRLDTVYVDVVAGATNSVTIATKYETVFSVSDITADAVYRPRAGYQDIAGTDQGVTNAYLWLKGDTVTVTVTSTDLGTNDVTVKLGVIDQ